MSDEIVFENPPAARGSGPRESHAIIAAQLREKPGQWALILRKPNERSASSTAYSIRTARGLRHYGPEGAFEAMSRTVDVKDANGVRHKEYRVYARYVGEKPSE